MRNVKITYNHITNRSYVFIDDKPLPSGSLSHFLTLPFSIWYRKLLPSLALELRDEFSLEFISRPLEFNLLNAIKDQCKECVQLVPGRLPISDNTGNRLNTLKQLQPDLADQPIKVKVFSDDLSREMLSQARQEEVLRSIPLCRPECSAQSLDELQEILENNPSPLEDCDARFIILNHTSPEALPLPQLDKVKGKTFILCSSRQPVDNPFQSIYFDGFTPDTLLRRYVNWLDFEVFPNKLENQLSLTKRNPETPEGLQLCMLDQVDAQSFVCEKHIVELNRVERMKVVSYPSPEQAPPVYFKSSATNVIDTRGMEIYGAGVGECRIDGYIPGNPAPICSMFMRCIKRNRIQQIELDIDQAILVMGDTLELKYRYYPEDADNVDQINIYVENPSLADANGNTVTALASGLTKVHVEAEGVDAVCELDIKDELIAIDFTPKELTVYLDESASYKIEPYPDNVISEEYGISWAGKGEISLDSRRQTITGLKPGKVTVTATDHTQEPKGFMYVTVKKRFSFSSLLIPIVLIVGIALIAFVFNLLF